MAALTLSCLHCSAAAALSCLRCSAAAALSSAAIAAAARHLNAGDSCCWLPVLLGLSVLAASAELRVVRPCGFLMSRKGCLMELLGSGCLWSAVTHSGSVTSSVESPGLIQDVGYLTLVEGAFSPFAWLAALLSASSLLLMFLVFLRKLNGKSSCALLRGQSTFLSSNRHQCCLYGQAQELKLW